MKDFIYCHPGRDEASLRLVYDLEGGPKIVWEDNKPTGEWSFHAFPRILGQLTGIDQNKQIFLLNSTHADFKISPMEPFTASWRGHLMSIVSLAQGSLKTVSAFTVMTSWSF